MRPIKFRAKAINREPDREYRTSYKNGDWVYGLITDFGNKDYTLPAQMTNENGVSNIDVDIDTLGQFIGLQDKNGKDIYEGDIIKTDQYSLFEVKFGEWNCGCCSDVYGYDIGDKHSMEVIGNVYDNPELLKEV